jgi:Spy/CpxP family protein refolding chaperone
MKIFFVASLICLAGPGAWSAPSNPADSADDSSEVSATEPISYGFGIEESAPGKNQQVPDECKTLNLTADQKTAIHTSMIAAERAKVQLEANLKVTKIDYMSNIASATGDATQADKLSADLGAEIVALAKNKLDFENNVFFKILTPEQRHPALMCEIALKHKMKHHQGKKSCGSHGHQGKFPSEAE